MKNKTCGKCGSLNDTLAKYCYHCGSELPELDPSERLCKHCGYENSGEAKFCISCGNPLIATVVRQSAVSSGKRKKAKRSPGAKPLPRGKPANSITFPLIVTGMILFGVIVLYLSSHRQPGNMAPVSSNVSQSFEQPSSDISLESRVYAIASRFVCACGSCGEESLESCRCPTAQKERQFIREALQHGHAEGEVIAAVNTTYGHLKPEFQSLFNK